MTLKSEYLNEIHSLEAKRNLLAKETTLTGQNKFIALSQFIRTIRSLEDKNMPSFILRDAVKATNDFVDNKITYSDYSALAKEMGLVHPTQDKYSHTLSHAMMLLSWTVFIVSLVTLPFIPALIGVLASFVLADIARDLKVDRPSPYEVSELGKGMNEVSRYSFADTFFDAAPDTTKPESKPAEEEQQSSSWTSWMPRVC